MLKTVALLHGYLNVMWNSIYTHIHHIITHISVLCSGITIPYTPWYCWWLYGLG